MKHLSEPNFASELGSVWRAIAGQNKPKSIIGMLTHCVLPLFILSTSLSAMRPSSGGIRDTLVSAKCQCVGRISVDILSPYE
jgi:hypothetical protein